MSVLLSDQLICTAVLNTLCVCQGLTQAVYSLLLVRVTWKSSTLRPLARRLVKMEVSGRRAQPWRALLIAISAFSLLAHCAIAISSCCFSRCTFDCRPSTSSVLQEEDVETQLHFIGLAVFSRQLLSGQC